MSTKRVLYVDSYIFGDWQKQCFWSFYFYGPECHSFARTSHFVLSGISLSQGLTQSKTLDCERQNADRTEVHNLTDQVVCLAAELILLPKQNFKSINSRRLVSLSETRSTVLNFCCQNRPIYRDSVSGGNSHEVHKTSLI